MRRNNWMRKLTKLNSELLKPRELLKPPEMLPGRQRRTLLTGRKWPKRPKRRLLKKWPRMKKRLRQRKLNSLPSLPSLRNNMKRLWLPRLKLINKLKSKLKRLQKQLKQTVREKKLCN